MGLVHGRSFPFQKLVPKRPGACTRWGLLSEFYGIRFFYENNEAQICPKQHLFRISRLHTEFYNFLYKWILAGLNLANYSSQIAIRLQITIYFGHTKEMILISEQRHISDGLPVVSLAAMPCGSHSQIDNSLRLCNIRRELVF